jgi:hypothetical protein
MKDDRKAQRKLERKRQKRQERLRREGRPSPPTEAQQAAREALAAFLGGLPGPLYGGSSCGREPEKARAAVKARGGEYLTLLVRTTNRDSCCGVDLMTLATVPLCDDPRCREDHRLNSSALAGWAYNLARADPRNVNASPAWAAEVARVTGGVVRPRS